MVEKIHDNERMEGFSFAFSIAVSFGAPKTESFPSFYFLLLSSRNGKVLVIHISV